MRRASTVLLLLIALATSASLIAACGSQNVSVSKSNVVTYTGAELFAQRCSGCHSLSYAGARGSASYVRDAQPNNGPNFNVRCERPITRVLYAIQNGGFSGAIMPQNIVVGEQARAVARFVATYAGRQSPVVPGVPICQSKPIGTLPEPNATAAATGPATTAVARPSAAAASPANGKRATTTSK